MTGPAALQDTSIVAAPTAAAASLASDILAGDVSLEIAVEQVAGHFIAAPRVEVFAAALTTFEPADPAGWLRLGERAWVREWLAPDASCSILPPPGAGPEAALSMPWLSQHARTGIVALVDAEQLPQAADQDRRELARFGIRALVACTHVAQDQMYGSLSMGSTTPGPWPEDIVADLQLLNAALTARITLAQARRSLTDSAAASARTREVNEQLLASVGHELRTPLSSILGYAELLMDEATQSPDHPLAVAVQRDGKVIVDACEQVITLVDEVLDAGRTLRADDGRERVDVAAAVDDVVHWHRAPAQAAEVTITTLVEPGVFVWAHPAGLRQVLSILVGNAVLHNRREGFVEISAQPLAGEVGDRRLRVVVRDNGPGLDRQQVGELFKPYGRLDGTGFDGHGLGLSLSRSLAERDSGTIGVESNPGVGSVFWVELPLARTDSAEARSLR